jgi:hypothetical protein
MKGTQFLTSFTDHPYYKWMCVSKDSLYLLTDGTWVYCSGETEQIWSVKLLGLAYTNLGDPYRELCELSMQATDNPMIVPSMAISKEDGARLYRKDVPTSPECVFRFEWGNLPSRG